VQAVPLTLLLIEHFFCGDRAEIGRNRPDTVGESTSKFWQYFFLCKFPQLFCLQRRHVGHTNFGTSEFANSIRPFCAHRVQPAVAMLASVEKPNAETSVQLGLDREVFRQRTDG